MAGLQNLLDFYTVQLDTEEVQATREYEVDWEVWSHIQTPGVLQALQEKEAALREVDYATEALAEVAMDEEKLTELGNYLAYNAMIHADYIFQNDQLIENCNQARPMETLNKWEVESMFKYVDCPSRWDVECNWILANNDSVKDDFFYTNMLQWQKAYFKGALPRYYYDWMGRHQMMCTSLKMSGWELER